MADRRVNRSGKNNEGDITALCGDWGRRSKAEAISDIESSTQTYYVTEAGYRSDVHVVKDRDGKYLRTDADSSSKNNLDNLPDC